MKDREDWIAFGIALGMVVIAGFIGGLVAAATMKMLFGVGQ